MKTTQFERFQLKPFLIEAIKDLGFYAPTDIQERLIPAILNGESAIGQSQTGTGKTHAYLIPILNKLDPAQNEVQAVITAPTRELAYQIHQELLKITKHAEAEEQITSKLLVGGTDRMRTIEKLKNQPHIVVGTPGRIKDLMKEQALKTYTAKIMVIDEADLTFDLGFLEDVDQIASSLPEDLQMLVFSATIPEKIKPFLKKYMDNPRYTHVAPKQATAKNIEHLIIPARHRDKLPLVTDILKSINPYLAIVFANTKTTADEVATHLLEKGIQTGVLHGGLPPRERMKVMKQLKNAEYQYLVATDLAARGIDIEGVSHVINFEFPQDLDFYVHRVGRTARAGHTGIAISIYRPEDEESLDKLEKRNIQFKNVDVKNGALEEIGDREKRKKRSPKKDELEQIAQKVVKKPKKVKPGYKKKRQREIESFKKQQRKRNNDKRHR